MNNVITYKPFKTALSPWGDLFEDFFDLNLNEDFKKPAVDIKENKTGFNFQVELPGYSEDEIDVRIEKNLLTIKAEKIEKEEKNSEEKDSKHIISERTTKCYRSFTLPENADGEKINAKFENGLLILDIAKMEKMQPKKIEIKK